jgi:hypothetical protein
MRVPLNCKLKSVSWGGGAAGCSTAARGRHRRDLPQRKCERAGYRKRGRAEAPRKVSGRRNRPVRCGPIGLTSRISFAVCSPLSGERPLARFSPPATKSAERRAFEHYLRTGRRLPTPAPERKFNPYHDPRNGQFTFAPGGPKSLQNAVFSDRRSLWKAKKQPNGAPTVAKPVETAEPAQGEIAGSRSDVRASSSGAVPSAEAEPALAKIQTVLHGKDSGSGSLLRDLFPR